MLHNNLFIDVLELGDLCLGKFGQILIISIWNHCNETNIFQMHSSLIRGLYLPLIHFFWQNKSRSYWSLFNRQISRGLLSHFTECNYFVIELSSKVLLMTWIFTVYILRYHSTFRSNYVIECLWMIDHKYGSSNFHFMGLSRSDLAIWYCPHLQMCHEKRQNEEFYHLVDPSNYFLQHSIDTLT